MIRVHKDLDNPPEILLGKSCKEKIKKAVKKKEGKKYTGHHYGHEQVKQRLKEDIYHHKCAYCESTIEHAAALQVEHYRPKDGLKVEKSGDKKHRGYYWLGCEWSNLLLACPKCNGKGAKGTRFPISGKRVYDGTPFDKTGSIKSFNRSRLRADRSPLSAEKPLLLNPEMDKPGDHLTFDRWGQIKGKTKRGKRTIGICKLDRDLLFKQRKNVADNILSDIRAVVEGVELGLYSFNDDTFRFFLNNIFKKIEATGQPEKEYALWGWFMYNEFEKCFVQKLRPEFRDPVRDAFLKYNGAKL